MIAVDTMCGMSDPLLIHGLLLDDADKPPELGWLLVQDGRIAEVGDGQPPEREWIGGPRALICPGFIDAHVHLPQFGFHWEPVGCDGMPLLEWLDRIIYPAEQLWADAGTACDQARVALHRMTTAGTLGFAGYLTSHQHAVSAWIDANRELDLRGIAGRMLMDREAPTELIHPPIDLQDVADEIRMFAATQATDTPPRMQVSINPRFAIACSDAMLSGVGALAAAVSPATFIQTHLAESQGEVERVAELFPGAGSYTEVYDRHRLLRDRTLLAHCLHLHSAEWSLIAERQASVVHCPIANTFLSSGLFDWRACLDHGIRVGLGSDVAAGPDAAMPHVARAMIEVAKLRRLTLDPDAHVPTAQQVWRMITRGNAELLNWPDAGRLEVGCAADLLVLEPDLPLDEWLINRLLYTWRDEYIGHRIINGRLVAPPLSSMPMRLH